jgi:hypothetical protein
MCPNEATCQPRIVVLVSKHYTNLTKRARVGLVQIKADIIMISSNVTCT